MHHITRLVFRSIFTFARILGRFLLYKYYKEMSENAHKVDEQIQGVHDKVPTAHVILFDDQLRVVNNEAAHYQESQIQVRLHNEE